MLQVHPLTTSAILLADTGDSGSFIDAAANGRIPASGNIPSAVAARLLMKWSPQRRLLAPDCLQIVLVTVQTVRMLQLALCLHS